MSLFPAIAAAVPVLALAAISRSFAQAKSMESKLIAAGVPHETKDAHALWGVAHLMNDMPVTKVMEMMLKRHGDIVVFRGANKLWVLVTDPKIVQQILIKYNLPKGDYSSIEGLLGDSMLSSNGLKWTHKRKAISPAFRVSFLQNVVAPVVVERATLMMDVLFPQEPAGGSIDLQDIFSKITLDVIGIAAFEYDSFFFF
ncbi:cytochrome P450, partial [Blastocladiella britannica]